MAEQTDSNFFTKKHQRLYRWSTWVNYFSWVVLIYYGLHAVVMTFFLPPSNSISPTLKNEILLTITNPLSEVSSFILWLLTGCFYWLILQSITAILNMLLETDLNYREKTPGENNNE